MDFIKPQKKVKTETYSKADYERDIKLLQMVF